MLKVVFESQEQQVPITNQSIPATAFSKFRVPQTTPPGDKGDTVPLRLFDPGFKNTAVCKSKISYVDVETGKLYYRGYDVEELVERSSYLEVAYLLVHGQLPTQKEFQQWVYDVMHHTYLHSHLEAQMTKFRYDAHPMVMTIATIASLSTFHPEANPAVVGDTLYLKQKDGDPKQHQRAENARHKAVLRMIGKVPTIVANAYRHRQGRSFNPPMATNNYCENLLYMMDRLNEEDYRPNSRLVSILDKLFIILAENGSNCSTVMIRHLVSSGVDPYTALSGAAGALFGERKNAAVVDMLQKIGNPSNVKDFLESIKESNRQSKASKGVRSVKLQGFGHRIYKSVDPRAKIAKQLLMQIIDLVGPDPLTDIAFELEKQAAHDPFFVSRNLHPNVDFWTPIIFAMLDFPSDMFPVWMFIPRVSGMIAHLIEAIDDPEYKIFRPRQIYVGHVLRSYDNKDDEDAHLLPAPPTKIVDRKASRLSFGAQVTPSKAELEREMGLMQQTLERMNLSLGNLGPDANQSSVQERVKMIQIMEQELEALKQKVLKMPATITE
ncbi:citrate synthase-like protein [Gorgonomyces haynaldii]|nr:citrate synthase-like protein [Gorgonomyces haynaldii]